MIKVNSGISQNEELNTKRYSSKCNVSHTPILDLVNETKVEATIRKM